MHPPQMIIRPLDPSPPKARLEPEERPPKARQSPLDLFATKLISKPCVSDSIVTWTTRCRHCALKPDR